MKRKKGREEVKLHKTGVITFTMIEGEHEIEYEKKNKQLKERKLRIEIKKKKWKG